MKSKVVEFEHGQRIAWCHFGGHRWRWEVEAAGAGRTRVTETFDMSTARFPSALRLMGLPKGHEKNVTTSVRNVISHFSPAGSRRDLRWRPAGPRPRLRPRRLRPGWPITSSTSSSRVTSTRPSSQGDEDVGEATDRDVGRDLGGRAGAVAEEVHELLHGFEAAAVEPVVAEGLGVEHPGPAPVVGDEVGDRLETGRRARRRMRLPGVAPSAAEATAAATASPSSPIRRSNTATSGSSASANAW